MFEENSFAQRHHSPLSLRNQCSHPNMSFYGWSEKPKKEREEKQHNDFSKTVFAPVPILLQGRDENLSQQSTLSFGTSHRKKLLTRSGITLISMNVFTVEIWISNPSLRNEPYTQWVSLSPRTNIMVSLNQRVNELFWFHFHGSFLATLPGKRVTYEKQLIFSLLFGGLSLNLVLNESMGEIKHMQWVQLTIFEGRTMRVFMIDTPKKSVP